MSIVEGQDRVSGGPPSRKPRVPRSHEHDRKPGAHPHSRGENLLTGMDWSSPEGRIIIAARADLTAHVGGNPNWVEKVLIERAARLQLYIEMMDAQALRDGTMSERNSRQYLA
jgi:hypothetical protein